MDERAHYYRKLKKPSWAPPAWLFGPVWAVLYILIFISYTKIFYLSYVGVIPHAVAGLFVLNLISNILFTPLQFVFRSNILASFDIIIVLVSLALGMLFAYQYVPFQVLILVPYLLWVSFASILQFVVTVYNLKK